jgi:hypothetical protein
MNRTRYIGNEDREWIREFIRGRWSGESVVVHGTVYYPHLLPGFVAEDERRDTVGLATFHRDNEGCEIITLDSIRPGEGIGTLLIAALTLESVKMDCPRLWCVTTNDNLPALKFYRSRGFSIVAVHERAVEQSRALKPSIPLVGIGGIPIQDEIELEMRIAAALHT